MAQFKGTIYHSVRLFAERTHGPEAVERVLARLDRSDRELLAGIASVGWYPTEPILAFHHELNGLYGPQDPNDRSLYFDVGRFSAEWALNTVLKLFVRFTSPNWMVNRSTTLWRRYHDSGRWEHAPTAEYPIQSRLHDFQVQDAAFCARLQGWLARATELSGGRGPVVSEPTCTSRGDRYCEFRLKWS